MGREVKRVDLGFDWPIDKVWQGYLDPNLSHLNECSDCKGSGYNEATARLADDWYDFARTGRKWCYALTQHEVDALVEHHRLYDFTHTWTEENGWQPKDPPIHPTAEQVNAWAQVRFGHDVINRGICVQARAEKMGVYGLCETCDGEGRVWDSPEAEAASAAWNETGPPAGEGWQMWETVSEGSPVSPVFATPEELARWLTENPRGVTADATYEQWLGMIHQGWAVSLVTHVTNGGMAIQSGVAAAAEMAGETD